MTTNPIDDVIMQVAETQWKKVAMIISRAAKECERRTISATYEDIAGRIETLVAAQKLESAGDLSNWRRSEVRIL